MHPKSCPSIVFWKTSILICPFVYEHQECWHSDEEVPFGLIKSPQCGTVTHGNPYKFSMLNSPQNTNLGIFSISPTWRMHFFSKLWGWEEDISRYVFEKFQNLKSQNIKDTSKSIAVISGEEIGKLGPPVLGASFHYF